LSVTSSIRKCICEDVHDVTVVIDPSLSLYANGDIANGDGVVGSWVGYNVGASLGGFVGCILGFLEVGYSVGGVLGLDVGYDVGTLVVGRLEGELVLGAVLLLGMSVGDTVGSVDDDGC
jgi:hypothetical protein